MNADRLLALYDRVAEAPKATTRLRRFVLDLAVRGKLVEQDPAEESARELSSRASQDGGRDFSLPVDWCRPPLGEILDFRYGKGLKASKRKKDGPVPVYGSNGIVGHTTEALTRQPCVIVGRKGSAGALKKCNGPSWTTDVAYFVEVPDFLDLHFLFISLSTLDLNALGKGVKPGLSRSDVYSKRISIPPLAEQHRIVAKVDELMALCERLEEARTSREKTRERLNKASLARLGAPDSDTATFHSNARFAIDSLAALTARADQIKHLHQTILDLAVRGKLIEQNPDDEPASKLLKRMASAKVALKRETGNPRIKRTPDPQKKDYPVPLPATWQVQSFENLFLFIDYRGRTPPKTDVGIPLITAKNVRPGVLNREPREFIDEKTYSTWMTRGLPQLGDLFFTTEAPMGNVCRNDIVEPFALAQRVICLRPYGEISTWFFMFAIMSNLTQTLIDEQSTGLTAKGIKSAKLKPIPIPVPPLAEQHRIAAKVDELMDLCDRLEAGLSAVNASRSHLFESVLHEALRDVS